MFAPLSRMLAHGALVLTLLFLSLACSLPSRADDAFSWIVRAAAAKHTLTFEGRQEVWMRAPNEPHAAARSVRIVADVTQAGPIVRMAYVAPASAKGRIMIDDGRWVRQWEAPRPSVLVDQSREEPDNARRRMLRLLRRNYAARALGMQRVDGFWCEKVAVTPRPGHVGPTRMLWIERARFAVLRAAEYDPAGRQRYTSSYESFRYVAHIPTSVFAPPSGMPRRKVGQTEREEPNFRAAFRAAALPGRLPCWLPGGYALVSCGVTSAAAGQPAVTLHYGDGLTSITVLEARASAATPAKTDWDLHTAQCDIRVLPNDALPAAFGTSLVAALDPKTESQIARALAQEFGPKAAAQARRLRRRGWGYDAIIALVLSPRAKPQRDAMRWIARVLHDPSYLRSTEGVSP